LFDDLLSSLSLAHVKNCDIKQAFVQSLLPPDETYFVRPPIGCPKSPPGTYWKLIRSFYGLRRAPKLWFDKLSSHLKSMSLRALLIHLAYFLELLLSVMHQSTPVSMLMRLYILVLVITLSTSSSKTYHLLVKWFLWDRFLIFLG
jgi:hypothetical protein